MMNKYADQAQAARQWRKLQRMCTSKRAYPTAEAASHKSQRVYQCPVCGKFHRSGKFGRFVRELKRINNA
jgi:hypothetical protein